MKKTEQINAQKNKIEASNVAETEGLNDRASQNLVQRVIEETTKVNKNLILREFHKS
jgi:hypothetical protein